MNYIIKIEIDLERKVQEPDFHRITREALFQLEFQKDKSITETLAILGVNIDEPICYIESCSRNDSSFSTDEPRVVTIKLKS